MRFISRSSILLLFVILLFYRGDRRYRVALIGLSAGLSLLASLWLGVRLGGRLGSVT